MSRILDRCARRIRQAPFISRAEWLWDALRPGYDAVLALTARRRGLERLINGTDRIWIAPAARHFVGERYEPEIWQIAVQLVQPQDTIVDVGAYIGLYAIAFASRAGTKGHVIAIEPDPGNADLMAANVKVNHLHNLQIMRVAAGEQSGEVLFAALNNSISHVAATGHHNPNLPAGAQSRGNLTVPMVTLDVLLAGQRIDFMKIDVEGFEEPVLKGAQSLLCDSRRRPRAILIEVHPYAWDTLGTSGDSLISYLAQCGYRTETPDGRPLATITHYGHIVAMPV
jgi:FkbM family methyltransferase